MLDIRGIRNEGRISASSSCVISQVRWLAQCGCWAHAGLGALAECWEAGYQHAAAGQDPYALTMLPRCRT